MSDITNTNYMTVESSQAVLVLKYNSMDSTRQTKNTSIYSGSCTIQKADYPSGVRLLALKRAVVVCFLVREEVATA